LFSLYSEFKIVIIIENFKDIFYIRFCCNA